MNKEKLIEYWTEAAEVDYKAMKNLYKSKDYVWSLFIGHLVIEKLMKAVMIRNNIIPVPKIHDLNKLAKRAGLKINNDLADELDVITAFNIEARYPDYKKEFYKKCDDDFTTKYFKKIKEIRLWLLREIKK